MVLLTIALVPSVALFGEEDDGVRELETTSAMESMWVDIHNPDNVPRNFRVFAIGAADETPVGNVQLLPAAQYKLDGGEDTRVLAVFPNLRPGELREARVCYAPENLPMNRTCESFAIKRL